MSKRAFRESRAPTGEKPAYPTLSDFDKSRRSALLHLGAIGALLLMGCGERRISGGADAGPGSDGRVPPQPDGPEGPSGAAPLPDARSDLRRPDAGPRYPDASLLEGDVAGPDARIDEPDQWPLAGGAPMPPAEIDGGR